MSASEQPSLHVFLERDVLPRLFERLARAYPEQGWQLQGTTAPHWRTPRGDTCHDPFEVVTAAGRAVPWLTRANGGRSPIWPQPQQLLRELAGDAGVSLPAREFTPDEWREHQQVPARRELLELLAGAATRALAGREGLTWRVRLAALGLTAEAVRELGLGCLPGEPALRAALQPQAIGALRQDGLLPEHLAGALLLPWRDPWRRLLGLIAVTQQGVIAPLVADPCANSHLLWFDRAASAARKDLVLVPDLLAGTVLQGRGATHVAATHSLPLTPFQRALLMGRGVQSLTVCLLPGADARALEGLEELAQHGIAVYVAELSAELPWRASVPLPALSDLAPRPRSLALHRLEAELQGLTPDSPLPERERAVSAAIGLARSLPASLAAIQRDELLARLTGATGLPRRTLARLLRRASSRARGIEYREDAAGLHWVRSGSLHQEEVQLANFTCRIRAIVDAHDEHGVTRRQVELETCCDGQVQRFAVAAQELDELRWVPERLGPLAYLAPQRGTKPRLLDGIKRLSGRVPLRRVHAHLGWCQAEGAPLYVHAAGAIGPAGARDDLAIELPSPLRGFHLPPPPRGGELTRALQASLRLLDLGPGEVLLPLYAALWRSALPGAPDLQLELPGPATTRSALQELLSSHWGPGAGPVTSEDLLTAAASRGGQALRPDALVVLAADRAPRAARGQPTPPLSGIRVLARPGSIDVPNAMTTPCEGVRLDAARADARDGLYARAMAGFLAWAAGPSGDALREEAAHADRGDEPRVHLHGSPQLLLGLRAFVRCAVESGALAESRGQRLLAQADALLGRDPLATALAHLRAAVASREAHLEDLQGGPPRGVDPARCGWHERSRRGQAPGWEPAGPRLGWVGEGELLLLPSAAHAALSRAPDWSAGGAWTERELMRRVAASGLLMRRARSRNTPCVRVTTGDGSRPSVLALPLDALLPADPCAEQAVPDLAEDEPLRDSDVA